MRYLVDHRPCRCWHCRSLQNAVILVSQIVRAEEAADNKHDMQSVEEALRAIQKAREDLHVQHLPELYPAKTGLDEALKGKPNIADDVPDGVQQREPSGGGNDVGGGSSSSEAQFDRNMIAELQFFHVKDKDARSCTETNRVAGDGESDSIKRTVSE